jgi:hypothetical protein
MSYLLGMICGNGEIKRSTNDTTVSIEIPHRKLQTEDMNDVAIYVKASVTDIRSILEPLIGVDLQFIQRKSGSILLFAKPNADYLIRQILYYINNGTSHENIRISKNIFEAAFDERKPFLRGFSDVTGYIRKSNYFFKRYKHRVYLEIPRNWGLVIDVCNLLRSVDIPVQTIDWAHPNMRDGNLKKVSIGYPNYWKKEHQIKIWANEFESIGFGVLHKKKALAEFANELCTGLQSDEESSSLITHKYYWELQVRNKVRPIHQSENDKSIPKEIRGKHYNSWRDIAKDLGYGK